MLPVVLIYDQSLQQYAFTPTHPFNPLRVEMTVDLLQKLKVVEEKQIFSSLPATNKQLELVHDPAYIQLIQRLDKGEHIPSVASLYGIGTKDTPFFPHMHQASTQVVGGSLRAVQAILKGEAKYALHLNGGLHHGFPGQASGFCIYNDCAVAIAEIRKNPSERVLYIDVDAHHGDGVQWVFYDDPDVGVFSVHETGKHLYPGTGTVEERGKLAGLHTTYNFPLEPFTEDASYLEVLTTGLTKIVEQFQPTIIVSQHGVDSHFYDPLTHLHTTMDSFYEIPKLIKRLADEWCNSRWVALGGGGYDIWRVVPRAWGLLWHVMNDLPRPIGLLPSAWINTWESQAPEGIIKTWHDCPIAYEEIPRREEITRLNRQMLKKALRPFQ